MSTGQEAYEILEKARDLLQSLRETAEAAHMNPKDTRLIRDFTFSLEQIYENWSAERSRWK